MPITATSNGFACKYIFFFQAEDGIRDLYVTGVQTCALPISIGVTNLENSRAVRVRVTDRGPAKPVRREGVIIDLSRAAARRLRFTDDGRARVRVEVVKLGDRKSVV